MQKYILDFSYEVRHDFLCILWDTWPYAIKTFNLLQIHAKNLCPNHAKNYKAWKTYVYYNWLACSLGKDEYELQPIMVIAF
jgi:hypothetical protein